MDDLPDEIVQCILAWTTPASTVALGQTSWRYWAITNSPLLWRLYCLNHFIYWGNCHRFQQKLNLPVSQVDWKGLYKRRHLVDIAVTDILESVLATQTGRIEKVHKIVSFGYDAKDTLMRHAQIGSDHEDYLARRNAILGCLHRTIAILEWSRLKKGEEVPLEIAIGAFDMFTLETGTGDLEDISYKLDNIVSVIKADCGTISELTPRQKAVKVAEYLRQKNLTGIDTRSEYYNVEHNFLGIALGLNAHPCGFPFHVHVILRPETGYDMDDKRLENGEPEAPMYMDPFRSAQEISIADLESQLNFLGALTLSHSTFLRESLTSEIVLRCGKNILNSVTQSPGFSDTSLDIASVEYAALWASVLFADSATMERPRTGPAQGLRHYLPSLMEHFATNFPFDVYLIDKFLVPLFSSLPEYDHLRESIHVMKTGDEIPKQIQRRGPDHSNVKYRVGQIFRHRRLGLLVEDKSARYVAEENIESVVDISQISPQFLKSLGRYFKRWDPRTRMFVSNIRDEYPDD
ncbi:conserved hypothetical protein [Uncinocarpus reesii 1704]|uniref:F-box domain-containing protein n=1 Tax=Uncinocarpus reesii (strain UAMH 1704) TaxID=336963 RepID=C4JWP8_UNCRE|nr:uncharacterized protein UREG_06990 [Uncinocarpus reesii 1704]EEP82125.1 conserved hypothetical protein [Uncinocarpus reesii 1704]